MHQHPSQPDRQIEDQAEAIATRAAESALNKMFAFLGYDITKASEIARWHANQQWVEGKRASEERRRAERWKLVVGALLTATAGLLVSAGSGVGKVLVQLIGLGGRP